MPEAERLSVLVHEHPALEEVRLVRCVREHSDKAAFERLYVSYYHRLRGVALSYTNDEQLAEDVVQTVFLKLWKRRHDWKPTGSVRGYLFSAVVNEALNSVRNAKVRREVSLDYAESSRITEMDEEEVMPQERERHNIRLQGHIAQAIDALPQSSRQIFILNRFSGLSYEEIADHLNISVNTVSTQMARALKALRKRLFRYRPLLSFLLIMLPGM